MSLPTIPIPAPGFHKNPGQRPDTVPGDTPVQVQWACGWVDPHTYKVKDLRWDLTGYGFDVGAVRAIGEMPKPKDGRQANGAYE